MSELEMNSGGHNPVDVQAVIWQVWIYTWMPSSIAIGGQHGISHSGGIGSEGRCNRHRNSSHWLIHNYEHGKC